MLGIHILWMVVRFALGFPIWGDEAFVVNNFADLSYGDLFRPLPNGQVAPLLWLWLEKACYDLGGGSIHLLRLPALLAGVISIWLMLRFCLRALPQPSALFGFAIFAAAYYPLRHAVEIKPYATDLLLVLIQLNLVLDLLHPHEVKRRNKAIWLVLVSLLGVWASYPSLFVSAAIAIYFLARKESRKLSLGASILFGITCLWMVSSFALPHARAAAWLMEMDMWTPAFPPLAEWWTLPWWFLERHCGYMSAYPTGGRDFGSSLSFLLILVGTIALWRSSRRGFLWILLGPLLFNFIAAAGHFYPYGGSIRVAIFMAPAFCLLMGHGLTQCIQKLTTQTSANILNGVCALLFCFVALGVVRDIRQPYKTTGDIRALEFAAWMAEHVAPGEEVLGWCNQKAGAPDFHGLGGSMARLRVQLRQAKIEAVWMNRIEQRGLASEQAVSTLSQGLWLMAYTDDNDTSMPFPQEDLEQMLNSLHDLGLEMEHFDFAFDKAERVDVYFFR